MEGLLGCVLLVKSNGALIGQREWFDSLSSEGQYESDFESIVLSRSDILFPQYFALPFKIPVESENGRRIPDLALIDRKYRHWWVVEVEMSHHSLNGHVLPQVDVFAHGRYGTAHRDHLLAQSNSLNLTALSDMIKVNQPRVLVIVNRNVPEWIRHIKALSGTVSVIEVFRSERNEHILRLNGEFPSSVSEEMVSTCRLDDLMPRLLQVDSPAALGGIHGDRLSISFSGGFTDWERVDSADRVWLIPVNRNPLSIGHSYVILRDALGVLTFKVQD